MAQTVQLDKWHISDQAEPRIRVGVIIDEDAMERVKLTLPDSGYVASADDGITVEVAGEVGVSLDADNVVLSVANRPSAKARTWRILPGPGEASGIQVHDVPAGRGFHWQKRIDHRLEGALELRRGGGGVVLINEVGLEAYLAGVITSEMSEACPLEMLKAQCVVARSWTLALAERKHVAEGFDMCNDDCCQRYQGMEHVGPNAARAVSETRGVALIAGEATVVDANYSKSCGGVSELPEHVWNVHKPGLTAVVDAPAGSRLDSFLPVTDENLDDFLDGDWLADTDAYCGPNAAPTEGLTRYLGRVDEAGEYFRWDVSYSREEIEELLRGSGGMADLAAFVDLRVTRRGESGRAIEIEIDYRDKTNARKQRKVETEYNIRKLLSRKFLFSSAFAVRIARDAAGEPERITLRGAGWGHGAGLCQIGALGMALAGEECPAILKHYFREARLVRVYD